MEDIQLSGVAETATVSGTVRSNGDPVAGVTIMVNDTFPLGATKALKTGADGTYTATVPVGDVEIAPSKAGMSFFPESHEVTTTKGSAISGLDFTGYAHGTIRGRVLNTSGGPMAGVKVTATPAGGGAVADSSRTDVRGVYSLSVPFGRYTVAAESDTHTFANEDGDATATVNVASGATESVDDFEATAIPRTPSSDATLSALSLSAGDLDPAFADSVTSYTAMVANDVASVDVTATANSEHAAGVVIMPMDADTVMAGHQVNLGVGATDITATVTPEDSSATMTYTVTVTRANANVTLSASPDPVMEGGMTTVTGTVDVAQADSFQVTVAPTGGTVGDNAVLSFAAGATASTGTVTVTAANNDVRNDPALTVTLKGTSSDATMMVDSLVVAVTDDELVATAPRNLRVTPGTTVGQVTVAWDGPQSIGSMPITSYEWEATATGQARRFGTYTTLDGDSLSVTLGNGDANNAALALGVEYTFTVHAVSSLGDGESASTAAKAVPSINTLGVNPTTIAEAGTDSAEVIVTLAQTTMEDVTVTLTVDSTHLADVIGGTMVIEAGTTTDTAYVKAKQNPVDADNTLHLRVTADNANAPDPDSVLITITDDDEAPGAPRNLTVTAGDTQLTLEWISPEAAGTSDIMRYEVRYRLTSGTDDDYSDWAEVGNAATRTHTITDLTNGSGYTVQVRAYSAAGGGAAATETGEPAAGE